MLADSKYQDEHSNLMFPEEMTVKSWFDYWITMNLYVHTTEDEKQKEIEKIATALKVV